MVQAVGEMSTSLLHIDAYLYISFLWHAHMDNEQTSKV